MRPSLSSMTSSCCRLRSSAVAGNDPPRARRARRLCWVCANTIARCARGTPASAVRARQRRKRKPRSCHCLENLRVSASNRRNDPLSTQWRGVAEGRGEVRGCLQTFILFCVGRKPDMCHSERSEESLRTASVVCSQATSTLDDIRSESKRFFASLRMTLVAKIRDRLKSTLPRAGQRHRVPHTPNHIRALGGSSWRATAGCRRGRRLEAER